MFKNNILKMGVLTFLLTSVGMNANSQELEFRKGFSEPKDPKEIEKLISETAENDERRKEILNHLKDLISKFNETFVKIQNNNEKYTKLEQLAVRIDIRIRELFNLEETCKKYRKLAYEIRNQNGDKPLRVNQISSIKEYEGLAKGCFNKQKRILSASMQDMGNVTYELNQLEGWRDDAENLQRGLEIINTEISQYRILLDFMDGTVNDEPDGRGVDSLEILSKPPARK